MVPLLEAVKATEAIRFIHTIVDFVLLAMYKSYDERTLEYMSLALFRINHYKEAFWNYRQSAKEKEKGDDSKEGHFNFPKFYGMVHYIDMIRLFRNAPTLEIGHFEHKHYIYVKDPFKRTNKKQD